VHHHNFNWINQQDAVNFQVSSVRECGADSLGAILILHEYLSRGVDGDDSRNSIRSRRTHGTTLDIIRWPVYVCTVLSSLLFTKRSLGARSRTSGTLELAPLVGIAGAPLGIGPLARSRIHIFLEPIGLSCNWLVSRRFLVPTSAVYFIVRQCITSVQERCCEALSKKFLGSYFTRIVFSASRKVHANSQNLFWWD
jgi:hypothetical protein